LTHNEIARLQTYLRTLFSNPRLRVVGRKGKDDSAEVMIEDEFIGVIFKDEEDEDLSYAFQMAILDIDLPD